MKAAVIATLLLASAIAHAEPVPRNTVSVAPRAFLGAGIALEYERDLPSQRVSVAGSLAVRATAGGDYDSSTVGVGAELRYWFRRHAVWTARPRGAAVGWYAAARVDVDRTSLSMSGSDLGTMETLGLGVRGGYRFAPWRGLEVRPYLGLAVRRDRGGGLPSWSRPGIDYGFSVGWSW